MKRLLTFLLLATLLYSCEFQNDKLRAAEAERDVLQIKVESLQAEITELKKNTDTILTAIRYNIKQGDLATAKQSLLTIRAHQLSARQVNELNKLFAIVNTAPAHKILKKSKRQSSSVQKSYGTTRVGAVCCDGTRSYATGRGACSHHGGVCQWLYK